MKFHCNRSTDTEEGSVHCTELASSIRSPKLPSAGGRAETRPIPGGKTGVHQGGEEGTNPSRENHPCEGREARSLHSGETHSCTCAETDSYQDPSL